MKERLLQLPDKNVTYTEIELTPNSSLDKILVIGLHQDTMLNPNLFRYSIGLNNKYKKQNYIVGNFYNSFLVTDSFFVDSFSESDHYSESLIVDINYDIIKRIVSSFTESINIGNKYYAVINIKGTKLVYSINYLEQMFVSRLFKTDDFINSIFVDIKQSHHRYTSYDNFVNQIGLKMSYYISQYILNEFKTSFKQKNKLYKYSTLTRLYWTSSIFDKIKLRRMIYPQPQKYVYSFKTAITLKKTQTLQSEFKNSFKIFKKEGDQTINDIYSETLDDIYDKTIADISYSERIYGFKMYKD